MNTAPTNGLYSLVKIGALTFAGAFFGALTVQGDIPTSLQGWKALLLPALGAGIAAEIYYLRTMFGALLTAQGGVLPVPAAPATKKTSIAPVATTMIAGVVCLLMIGCPGSVTPSTVQTTLSPAETCLAGDALSIALAGGFANPAVAITQLLAACGQATIDDIIALFDKLAVPNDAGVVNPNVIALRNEALRQKALKASGSTK